MDRASAALDTKDGWRNAVGSVRQGGDRRQAELLDFK